MTEQRRRLLAFLAAERRLAALCTRHVCVIAGRCDHAEMYYLAATPLRVNERERL